MLTNTYVRFKLRLARCFAIVFLILPALAHADTVNVGYFSYDTLDAGPNGTNVFNIFNFTGASALPPDFPVVDPLTFTSVMFTLTGPSAPLTEPIPLDDIPPGPFTPPDTLKFPDTAEFLSAMLSFTLNQTSFLLADNTTFVADSAQAAALLLPSPGNASLMPGDLQLLEVTGHFVDNTAVPEPASFPIALIAFAAVLCRMRSKRRLHSTVSS